ncbi:MAG TPA: signal peptide peptidase SppA [Myxococcota bacterium]|nr:signal peptide peptidase SppA [Myxococcota bacterium]
MRRIRRHAAALALAVLALLALAGCGGGPSIAPGSTLVLTLEGEYAEGADAPLLARFLGAGEGSLLGLYSAFRKAELDPRITRVVVRVRGLGIGWGKAQELRAAIARVNAAGKETVAVLETEGFGAGGYYVASAAKRVVATPASRSPLLGLAAEHLFFAGLFEKLGVMVEYERAGDYKSAVEPFTAHKMSAASREMTNALLDSTEAAFASDVAAARRLEPAALRALIDEAPSSAQDLLDAKLIDEIAYYEDVVTDAPIVEQEDWAAVDVASLGVEPQATFALISGAGMVVTGKGEITASGTRVMAADTFVDAVHEAIDDAEVKALLVRIDSPGGSPLASDLMWRALRDARAAGKPVVVSLSDVAASGGYYVASAADTIVSHPTSLTGSIGVFVIRPSLGGLLEKVGVTVETMQRGARADLLFGSQPLTAGAREVLRKDVEGVYEQFVARVAEGRALDLDAVKKVGGGRVWTGAQALEIGLVDELGGLYEAAVAAKKAVGIAADAPVSLKSFPAQKTLAQQIGELLFGARAQSAGPLDALPRELRDLHTLVTALPVGAPLLVPPSVVVLH